MNEPVATGDESTAHHVAVTVFTVVRTADVGDAAYIAERGIRQALQGADIPGVEGWTIEAKFRDGRTDLVRVHVVCEVGMAVRGGLLDVRTNPCGYPKVG